MKASFALFALCTLTTTAVLAEDGNGGKVLASASSAFASLDRNADGRLSRSEAGFDRTLSVTFAEIDSDADGFVTPAEFAASERKTTTARTASSK